jgi:AAA+ superfamily predicted ATPase
VDNTRDLRILLASSHPLVFVETREEDRALRIIRRAAAELETPVWTWSVTRGLRRDGAESQYGTEPLDAALGFIEERRQPGVFVLTDAGPLLDNAASRRRLREVAQSSPPGQTVLITGAQHELPPDLNDVAHIWTLRPPGRDELYRIARRTLGDLSARGLTVAVGQADLDDLVSSLAGLTVREAERAIQRAAVADGRFDRADLSGVRIVKAEMLNQDGILELIESADVTLDDVGGLAALKSWLAVRGPVFLNPTSHLDPPRGILLTGIPGCGKSFAAKALAASWRLPLILLDPSRLYGKYVGESEQRLARALTTIETMNPVVVWIDEIEKGFATSSDGDGGVSTRVLGTFLRWLQERPGRIFLIATANDVRSLPAELLRKGRFDEIFFVDVPDEAERADILRYHLTARGESVDEPAVLRLAAASDGFTGSELEMAVVGALYRSHADDERLRIDHVLQEFAATVPLTRSRPETVMALRQWAEERARTA